MRGEFIAIGAAFDLVPQIITTGLYATVFNQVGNYTYTLPAAPGTLATTANVATETARALAAEAVLASAAGFNAGFLLWWASLPTALPATAGVAWNNGGIPCVS